MLDGASNSSQVTAGDLSVIGFQKSLHSRPEPELPFGSMSRGTNPAGDRLQSLTSPCHRPLMLRILYDLPTA